MSCKCHFVCVCVCENLHNRTKSCTCFSYKQTEDFSHYSNVGGKPLRLKELNNFSGHSLATVRSGYAASDTSFFNKSPEIFTF